LAAPHFNVLPRIFPQIKMVAFNAISEQRYVVLILIKIKKIYAILAIASYIHGRPYEWQGGHIPPGT